MRHKLSLEIVMPTRNVVLTDSQAKYVEQMVDSGRYQNASEAVAVGTADIEAGRYTEFSDAESLDAYLANIADRAINAV